MSNSKTSFAYRRRLSNVIKVASLLAALAFVTVVLEQPRLTASPSHPRATAEQGTRSALSQAATGERSDAAMRGDATTKAASESLPEYFPGQFAQPGGTVDQHPASF